MRAPSSLVDVCAVVVVWVEVVVRPVWSVIVVETVVVVEEVVLVVVVSTTVVMGIRSAVGLVVVVVVMVMVCPSAVVLVVVVVLVCVGLWLGAAFSGVVVLVVSELEVDGWMAFTKRRHSSSSLTISWR